MLARPRRSVLYMPGCNAKALAKASTLPADALILDLEDSVAPDQKIDAAIATIMAIGRALAAVPERSRYEDRQEMTFF